MAKSPLGVLTNKPAGTTGGLVHYQTSPKSLQNVRIRGHVVTGVLMQIYPLPEGEGGNPAIRASSTVPPSGFSQQSGYIFNCAVDFPAQFMRTDTEKSEIQPYRNRDAVGGLVNSLLKK